MAGLAVPVLTQSPALADGTCVSPVGCNLSGQNLTNANLNGDDLTGVNLNGTNLTSATLSGAKLTDANFNGANLKGADLSAAKDAETANFNKVTWSNTTCPDGSNSNTNNGTCIGHLTTNGG